MRAFTEAEIRVAEEIFFEFLCGMPELGIHADFPGEQEIVDTCYDGKTSAYIWESFENFLDQCIDAV